MAENSPGLGVVVAAHAPGHQPVEGAGEDEERHVEIDFEADRRGERIDVEDPTPWADRIFVQQRLGLPVVKVPGLGFVAVVQREGGPLWTGLLTEQWLP